MFEVILTFNFIFRSLNFDELFPETNENSSEKSLELKSCHRVYSVASTFLLFFNENDSSHIERLEKLCKYLIFSLESDSTKTSYIGVALTKDLRFVKKTTNLII